MILTGPEIREQIRLGNIEIDPYVPEHVNPASVDLTLGDQVLEYAQRDLDLKREPQVLPAKIFASGFTLFPGRLYLMHTVERVMAKRFVPIIDGKSSLGRLGVSIHQTAGYGDPGFNGQYTLEVSVVGLPVKIYAGVRFAQIRFHAVQGEIQKYEGNYVGERATGPVASQSWRQFK